MMFRRCAKRSIVGGRCTNASLMIWVNVIVVAVRVCSFFLLGKNEGQK